MADTKTHLDFKSLVALNPTVYQDLNAICDYMEHIFLSYPKTVHIISLDDNWKLCADFRNSLCNLDSFDRLYHMEASDGSVEWLRHYSLLARVSHEQPVYLELYFGLDEHGNVRGTMSISRDADLFMNVVLDKSFQSEAIYESLREDGVAMDIKSQVDIKEAKKRYNKYIKSKGLTQSKRRIAKYHRSGEKCNLPVKAPYVTRAGRAVFDKM